MKRSPSQGDLGAMSNGASRGVHHDLHFGGESRTSRPNQPMYPPAINHPPAIPGQWPSSPPPSMQQMRPVPQQTSSQWAPPVQSPIQPPLNSRPNPYANPPNQWAQPLPANDFLDMPEPSTTPIPPPLPARQQTTPLYQWDPNSDPRTLPQKPPYGPLDTLPATLTAGLPRYNTPPTLPPKVPFGATAPFSSSPPPLPHRDHDPYHEHYHQQPNPSNFTPPKQTPSPRLHPDDNAYYPSQSGYTPPPRPSTGPRLSPDPQYGFVPPRRSSHPEHDRPSNIDAPFFVPPTQRPPSNPHFHETTPPRPERYSPRPSPPGNLDYSSPVGHATQYPPQQPIQCQEPPRAQYQEPPRPQYQQPRPDPYQQPRPDPYRRPSPTHIPQRHSSPHPSPPRQPEWQPSPPPRKGPAGPVTSDPPPNSLINLRHLPFPPILQPAYHRATLDHPQHFAKSSLLKILVIPAENTTFVAGGEIYGRMDINSKGDGGGSKGKSELLVGEIGIELIAYDGKPLLQITRIYLMSRNTLRIRGISGTISCVFTFETNFSGSL
jgi:hypothetical protein